jgi:hypothetical protein
MKRGDIGVTNGYFFGARKKQEMLPRVSPSPVLTAAYLILVDE